VGESSRGGWEVRERAGDRGYCNEQCRGLPFLTSKSSGGHFISSKGRRGVGFELTPFQLGYLAPVKNRKRFGNGRDTSETSRNLGKNSGELRIQRGEMCAKKGRGNPSSVQRLEEFVWGGAMNGEAIGSGGQSLPRRFAFQGVCFIEKNHGHRKGLGSHQPKRFRPPGRKVVRGFL